MSSPTVSVILPVYNGEQFVRFAIDSVLNQTHQDFELIVIDDGSSDSTPDIVREYGAPVRYVRQDNTGVAGAFNHGLRLAAGRFISWLSHDDVFLPTKLEKQLQVLERSGEPAVCYSDIQVIGPRGEVLREETLPEHSREEALRHVLTGGRICSASYSVMYDRRCIDAVGGYAESWPQTQDLEMLARLARRFALIHVPETLIQVREHPGRGVRSKKWEVEVLRFFREKLNDFPVQELFPECGPGTTKQEIAAAYAWVANTMAAGPYPYYKSAYSLYGRVLRANPAGAARLLPNFLRLLWRHFRQHVNRYSLHMKFQALTTRRPDPAKW